MQILQIQIIVLKDTLTQARFHLNNLKILVSTNKSILNGSQGICELDFIRVKTN